MTSPDSQSRSNSTDAEQTLRDFLAQFAKKRAEYEATQIKCGIVGRSGVGKSSLMNAIVDKKLAPVGSSKETTLEAHEYVHRGLVLVDLPGCGTKTYPTKTYVGQLSLKSYDFFIFATDARFFEDEATVYDMLAVQLKKPCFLTRNKFDLALSNAIDDGSTLSEGELKQEIEGDIRKNLAPHVVEKIYMVSSRKPTMYDLPDLLEDITKTFSGMKRMRLENDFAALTREALEQKKKNALQVAAWYAGGAALNGLNPIPGLDVAIDVAMLIKMVYDVSSIYNITPEQQSYWEKMMGGPQGIALITKMAALMSKYGTEAAVTVVLKTLGKREFTNVFKYVLPFIGPLVASGAGYYLTYNFGASVVEEYHAMAEELLAECLRRQG